MGSRYGGFKQIDSFSLEGDTIIDFSLYDALQAGFGKVVFIIRKSFEKEFKAVFNKKLAGKVEVTYVFQELEKIPHQFLNAKRVKPWGTGHALLMLKDIVKENFAIINADDFYSRQAFDVMAAQLKNTDENSCSFSMVAYSLKNTVSDNGYVSRGACTVNENGFLTAIVERVRIEKIDGVLKSEDEKGQMVSINEQTTVSMNFWGFTPKCFEFGAAFFLEFLKNNKEDLEAEFYLPTIISKLLVSKKATVKVLESDSKWFGVTYREDKETVQKEICKLKAQGVYPTKLWN